MAKVILGARPQNFAPSPIKFPLPDGTEGVVHVTYKYRTRVEFGEMLDSLINGAGAARPDAAVPPALEVPSDPTLFKVDYAGMFAKARDSVVDQLLLSIVSWDLDMPLSRETLTQLADELPAGGLAMMVGYNRACTEGHLGN